MRGQMPNAVSPHQSPVKDRSGDVDTEQKYSPNRARDSNRVNLIKRSLQLLLPDDAIEPYRSQQLPTSDTAASPIPEDAPSLSLNDSFTLSNDSAIVHSSVSPDSLPVARSTLAPTPVAVAPTSASMMSQSAHYFADAVASISLPPLPPPLPPQPVPPVRRTLSRTLSSSSSNMSLSLSLSLSPSVSTGLSFEPHATVWEWGDAGSGSPSHSPTAASDFEASLLSDATTDIQSYYFHAQDPFRHIIEDWDGSDETAEKSSWIEVPRDNSNALKQASIQKNCTDLADVARLMRAERGIPTKTHEWKNNLYAHSFAGCDVIDWLLRSVSEEWGLFDRKMAFHLAHSLLACGFIRPCPPTPVHAAHHLSSETTAASLTAVLTGSVLSTPASPATSASASASSASASASAPVSEAGGRERSASSSFANPFIMPFLPSHVVCFCPCAFCVRHRRGNTVNARRRSVLPTDVAKDAQLDSLPHALEDAPVDSLCADCPTTCSCCASRSCRNAFKRPHPPIEFVDGFFFYQFTDEPPVIVLNPLVAKPAPVVAAAAASVPLTPPSQPRRPLPLSSVALAASSLTSSLASTLASTFAPPPLPPLVAGPPVAPSNGIVVGGLPGNLGAAAALRVLPTTQSRATSGSVSVSSYTSSYTSQYDTLPASTGSAAFPKSAASNPLIDLEEEHELSSFEISHLGASLVKTMLKLYREVKFLDPTLIPIQNPEGYAAYRRLASKLRWVNLDLLNQEFLLAFFLNIFNALYMHLLVVSDLVHDSQNKIKRLALMRRLAYQIGPDSNTFYSTMDIKYGVLRACMPFPEIKQKDRFTLLPPMFLESDVRLRNVILRADPRITFAICNGTQSSPRLQIFSPDTIYEQLESCAVNYIRDHVKLIHYAAPTPTPPLKRSGSLLSASAMLFSSAPLSPSGARPASASGLPSPVATATATAAAVAHARLDPPRSLSTSALDRRPRRAACAPLDRSRPPTALTPLASSFCASPLLPPLPRLSALGAALVGGAGTGVGGAETAVGTGAALAMPVAGAADAVKGRRQTDSAVPSALVSRVPGSALASRVPSSERLDKLVSAAASSAAVMVTHVNTAGTGLGTVLVGAVAELNEHEDLDLDDGVDDEDDEGESEPLHATGGGGDRVSGRVPVQRASVVAVPVRGSIVLENAATSVQPRLGTSALARALNITALKGNTPLAVSSRLPPRPHASNSTAPYGHNRSLTMRDVSSTLDRDSASLLDDDDYLYHAEDQALLSTSFEPPAHTSAADSQSRLIVLIPKLFDWYRPDFGKSSENLLTWIAQHHPDWMSRCQISDYLAARAVTVQIVRFSWQYDSAIFSPTIQGSGSLI